MYKIAGLNFDFSPDLAKTNPVFKKYRNISNCYPQTTIQFVACDALPLPKGRLLLDDAITWYIDDNNKDQYFAYYRDINDPKKFICRFDYDREWKKVIIHYLKNIPNIEYLVTCHFTNLVTRNLVVMHEGLIIHASAIKYQNKAYVFTAPSGTGKSTHTRMWESFYNAIVINDDTPIIKYKNSLPYVYGTPWSGSKQINSNQSAPLGAIIAIEQSKENSIRKLEKHEIIKYVLPRFLMPYQDNVLMDAAIRTFNKIITDTPVYILCCRPDRQAVDLVHQCLIATT